MFSDLMPINGLLVEMSKKNRSSRSKKARNGLFSASRLAVKNTRLSRFLNKLINNCQVHKNAVIHHSIKISHCGASTVIGKNVLIGENVHIYHNVTIGTKEKYDDSYPVIEDNVTIYPGSIIIGGVTIGKGSVIGAHSFVNRNISPYSKVYSKNILIVKEMMEPQK
jgi:serine acetyltransferase